MFYLRRAEAWVQCSVGAGLGSEPDTDMKHRSCCRLTGLLNETLHGTGVVILSDSAQGLSASGAAQVTYPDSG